MQLANFILEPLFTIIFLGLTAIVLLLWHSSRKQRYWKNIGIPFEKPLPIFGSLLQKLFKPLYLIELERFKKFGRIYGHYEGNRALLSVAEPELIHDILVKDYQTFTSRRVLKSGNKTVDGMLSALRGEDWKKVRSIVSTTFTADKTKQMMDIFDECSKTLVKNIREASSRQENIDAKSAFSAFAMDIIASSAYSCKIDSHKDRDSDFVTTAKAIFSRKISWRVLCFVLCPPIMKLFSISVLPPKAINFFTDTVLRTTEERKRMGKTENDYLQLLIDATRDIAEKRKLNLEGDEDISKIYGKVDSNQMLQDYIPDKSLSEAEFVSQCVIFFFAGYVTTASVLSFLSYELALNPDIQERVTREIYEVISANGGEMTYDALQSMKYLDNVIAETLRLYPPFVRLERLSDGNYKLGDTGLTVPKGMIVTIPIYTLHRDPKFFPDPEKFDPDRFSPEKRDQQVPYSYLPFGAGSRSCVAMRFALMEIKMCIAHLLRNFRIKKCSTTKVPVEYDQDVGFLQPKNVPLFLEERKNLEKKL